jgi:CheY-like chemotaxis protein
MVDMGKMRILVIDDMPQIRKVICRMLKGHEVVECTNGRDALCILSDDDAFDVILSDMDMGIMDGEMFYVELARRSPLMSEKVVFVTGGGGSIAQDAFLKMAPCPVVMKPFRAQDLNYAMSSVCPEMMNE